MSAAETRAETRNERRIRLHHQLVRRRRYSNALDDLLITMYGAEAAREYGIIDRRGVGEREHCPCCCSVASR